MPIYEYQCTTCGHDFDKLQKIGADAPPCPECGADVRKKVSASAFVLKGSGWYRDHYGLKKAGSDKPAEAGAAKTEGGSKESGGSSSGSEGGGSSGSEGGSASSGSSSAPGSAKASASEG